MIETLVLKRKEKDHHIAFLPQIQAFHIHTMYLFLYHLGFNLATWAAAALYISDHREVEVVEEEEYVSSPVNVKNGANTNTARGKEKNWPNSKLKLKWRLHYHKIIINIIGTNKSHKKFGRTKAIKKKKKTRRVGFYKNSNSTHAREKKDDFPDTLI